MKTQKGWTGGANGTNESGFNSIESGFYRADAGIFYGDHFVYWSLTSEDETQASRHWHSRAYGESVLKDNISKKWGHSIRCLKDRPGQCNLIEKINPSSRQTTTGNSISFNVPYNSGTASFKWQSNSASTGWSDIVGSSDYQGVQTPKLTISNTQASNHLQQLRLVAMEGNCFDTSDIARVYITDTCFVTLTDTILTTVTDTLVIDVMLTGTNTPTNTLIRVYPNPTSSQLIIENSDASLLGGYTMTITNAAGSTVWTESISQPSYTLDLLGWGGKGLYYITLTDPQGKVVTTRKIVLQ
jgi:hypothetical protein